MSSRSSASEPQQAAGMSPPAGQHQVELQKFNIRELYPIVKALQFRDDCTVTFNAEGIRLIVDDQHNEQCNCYFRAEIFDDYELRSATQIHLRCPIAAFAEALNAFSGQSAVLKLHYDGEGEPLVMNVEDEGVVYTSSINTLMLQQFDPEDQAGKVLLHPGALRTVIRELDATSESVLITITRRGISFVSDGHLGKIRINIPAKSDQVESLECSEGRDQVQQSYRITLVKRMQPVVALCNKVSLRIDSRGVLNAQFLVPISERQNVFIDFLCVADNERYRQNDEYA